jgi:hypothetical protein
LKQGDQIIIDEVVSRTTDHILEHQHDCEIRCAYLVIRHHDGTQTRPSVPLTFRGRNELLNANHPLNVLSQIEHRIKEYFGREEYKIGNRPIAQNMYAKRAFLKLTEVMEMLEVSELFNTSAIVDQAIFLGYLWAKSETEGEIKPKALARIKASKTSSDSAKILAAQNSDKANKGWRIEAAEFVKTIYQEDRSRSNNTIIQLLSTRQAHNEKLPYGEKTLKVFIKSMRESGQIGQKIPKTKPPRTGKIAKS